MIGIVIKSLYTFFAIYGIVYFIKSLVSYFYDNKNELEGDTIVVIKVKNAEEKLESAIRLFIWRWLRLSGKGAVPNILIVDMGSTDETAMIADRLSKEYSFIYCTDYENYRKAKENIE